MSTTVSEIKGYYTVEEAAEIIGVSRSQMTRYIQSERLKAKSFGKQYLIEEREVHNFKRRPRGNPNFKKTAKHRGN